MMMSSAMKKADRGHKSQLENMDFIQALPYIGLYSRTSYKDYSLQSRLHFRIHAAQNQLREVTALCEQILF